MSVTKEHDKHIKYIYLVGIPTSASPTLLGSGGTIQSCCSRKAFHLRLCVAKVDTCAPASAGGILLKVSLSCVSGVETRGEEKAHTLSRRWLARCLAPALTSSDLVVSAER